MGKDRKMTDDSWSELESLNRKLGADELPVNVVISLPDGQQFELETAGLCFSAIYRGRLCLSLTPLHSVKPEGGWGGFSWFRVLREIEKGV